MGVGSNLMKRRTVLSAVGVAGLSSKVRAQATMKKRTRRAVRAAQDRAGLFIGSGDIQPFPVDPGSHPASLPYLHFKISPDDGGDPNAPRTTMAGFINRKPTSIEWRLSESIVLLHVYNGGKSASDLFRVDYQIVYCTFADHKAADGFSTLHAGEADGSTAEDLLTADYLLPGKSTSIAVKLSKFATLKNIYVRARVSTLFSPLVPMKDWSFAKDPQVVEGWTSYEG